MDDLIINVDALEEANQPFEADLPRDLLDEVLRADPPTEFHANGAARLKGRATKLGRKVLVQARATVPLRGQCRRCLKPVMLDEQVDLIRSYVPADQLPGRQEHHAKGSEASLDPEGVDEEPYEGKEIDLKPAVREQILLQIPGSPLCGEDCKGLCPRCGKDLNEGDCGCDRTALDPRWAALKGIQLEKKKEK
ncbi:MAG: DUF177 domain-containing protein [Myxococcales bacterium]|nr:DUF177 domain-containing protein [Myxococcales bacterium]